MQEAKEEGRAMLNRQDEPSSGERMTFPVGKEVEGFHGKNNVDGAGEIKRIVLISSYSIEICNYC